MFACCSEPSISIIILLICLRIVNSTITFKCPSKLKHV